MSFRPLIVAGIHSIEGFEQVAAAGTDECFVGYIPHSWYLTHTSRVPANRREVLFYNTQIGSFSDMQILHRISTGTGTALSVAFNAPFYPPTVYPLILDTMRALNQIGYAHYIIADPGLLFHIQKEQIPCRIHLSGEFGPINTFLSDDTLIDSVSRIIFHRDTTLSDMQKIRNSLHGQVPEYEAFFLNERCHFTGSFCNSLHCDLLPPICRIPYELSPLTASDRIPDHKIPDEIPDTIGCTGCGLCSLPDLIGAGVTHLKIVGRGNHSTSIAQDVLFVRSALDLYASDPDGYPKRILEMVGPDCSHQCYYPK